MLKQNPPLPVIAFSCKCLLLVIALLASAAQAQTKHEQLRDDMQSLAFLTLGNPDQPPKLSGPHGELMKRAFSYDALVALYTDAIGSEQSNQSTLIIVFIEYNNALNILQRRYAASFKAFPGIYSKEYLYIENLTVVIEIAKVRNKLPHSWTFGTTSNDRQKITATTGRALAANDPFILGRINAVLKRIATNIDQGLVRDDDKEFAQIIVKLRLEEVVIILNVEQINVIKTLAKI
jgi:hypothetical protein